MPKFHPAIAVEEHLLSGHQISHIEATLLFGLQNLSAELTRLKMKGFIVKSQRVPLAKIIRRMNEYMVCKPPTNLPIKEVNVMEYWISK